MAEQKYNIPNLYVDLIRKIKQIEGVDIEYIDRLVEILYNDINLIGNAVDSIMSYIPSGTSDENQLVNDTDLGTIELDLETLTASVSHIDMCMPGTASSTNKLATLADIPAVPVVINPVYLEFTLDSDDWVAVSGVYHWGTSISVILQFGVPCISFIRPLSAATETAAEKAAFDLITSVSIFQDIDPDMSHIEITAGATQPPVDFKIGVIAWK